MKGFRVLFLGDLVGLPGQYIVKRHLDHLRTEYNLDLVIANGENANTDSRGLTRTIVKRLRSYGVDVITTGNHVWDQTDVYDFLQDPAIPLIRPHNFLQSNPGCGIWLGQSGDTPYAVIQVQGRVLMSQSVADPFESVQELIATAKKHATIVLLDFHAQATSEKLGMGFFVDGSVSACVGTHTHVQTRDARILPQGTAYITDLGMCGPYNSMIGAQVQPALQKMRTHMPQRVKVETDPPYIVSGLIVDVDPSTGLSSAVTPIFIQDDKTLFEV